MPETEFKLISDMLPVPSKGDEVLTPRNAIQIAPDETNELSEMLVSGVEPIIL